MTEMLYRPCPWVLRVCGETPRCTLSEGHDGDHVAAWRDRVVFFPQVDPDQTWAHEDHESHD